MSALLKQVFDAEGYVMPSEIAKAFHTTVKEVAGLTGLPPSAISKRERIRSPKHQARLRETVEIINRIIPWAGSELQAYAWFRSEPIPAFGDLTAEEVVKQGHGSAVREYLEHLALGGYA